MKSTGRGRADAGYRSFTGKALLVNVLRILHLAGVVGVGAAVLGAPSAGDGMIAYVLVLVPGGLIVALDWWSNAHYPFQLKGLGMAVKLALVAWMAFDAEHRMVLFWIVLAGSSALSHGPGRLRGYSPWPGRSAGSGRSRSGG